MQQIQINLPENIIASMNAAVESGSYSSPSEFACVAIERMCLSRKVALEELRALCQAGIDSGVSLYSSIDEIITEAKRRKSEGNA